MESVLEPQLLLAMAATVLAGIVRGFSGFGSAMMQAPVFAILYAPAEAVGTMAILGTAASFQLLPSTIRDAHWREVVPMSLAALVTVPMGAYVLLAISAGVMRRAIAAMVLAMVLLLMSGLRYPFRTNPLGASVIGGISGVINGATGVGGPPAVLYLLASTNTATTNRATLINYYVFLGLFTTGSLAWHGVITPQVLWRSLIILPVQIGSLWFGSWLFRRASDQLYRRIALGLLLAVALFGLLYSP